MTVYKIRTKTRRSQSAASKMAMMTGTDYGAGARVNGKWTANKHPPITELEVDFVRSLMEDYGSMRVARWMRVSESTALRVASGLGHKCRPETMGAVREFFAEADLESARQGVGPAGRDSPTKRGTKTNGERKAAASK